MQLCISGLSWDSFMPLLFTLHFGYHGNNQHFHVNWNPASITMHGCPIPIPYQKGVIAHDTKSIHFHMYAIRPGIRTDMLGALLRLPRVNVTKIWSMDFCTITVIVATWLSTMLLYMFTYCASITVLYVSGYFTYLAIRRSQNGQITEGPLCWNINPWYLLTLCCVESDTIGVIFRVAVFKRLVFNCWWPVFNLSRSCTQILHMGSNWHIQNT